MGAKRRAEEAAQDDLFRAHYPRLAGWAAGLLDDREAGHDVAAEAFVKVLNSWGTASDPAGLLWVAAANIIRDRWRRDRSRDAALATVRLQAATTVVEAQDVTVRDLVDRLPQACRVPVLLYYYADLGTDEIAQHLGRPPGTVRRQLTEARASLRSALETA